MINESSLKHDLTTHLKKVFPGAVVLSHSDQFTAGIPDVSVTCSGQHWAGTVWLELKHVTPRKRFKGTDIQRQTAIELASHSSCYYVIYEEHTLYKDITGRRTHIIHPAIINEKWISSTNMVVDGFDHYFVADFLKGLWDLNG